MQNDLTTKTEFNELPLLLTYSQVLACGIRRGDLPHYLTTGQITFVQPRGQKGKRRYRKRDLAKVLGLEM